nr:JmjC domain-containing protein [Tanacetum cinerariifolium]
MKAMFVLSFLRVVGYYAKIEVFPKLEVVTIVYGFEYGIRLTQQQRYPIPPEHLKAKSNDLSCPYCTLLEICQHFTSLIPRFGGIGYVVVLKDVFCTSLVSFIRGVARCTQAMKEDHNLNRVATFTKRLLHRNKEEVVIEFKDSGLDYLHGGKSNLDVENASANPPPEKVQTHDLMFDADLAPKERESNDSMCAADPAPKEQETHDMDLGNDAHPLSCSETRADILIKYIY